MLSACQAPPTCPMLLQLIVGYQWRRHSTSCFVAVAKSGVSNIQELISGIDSTEYIPREGVQRDVRTQKSSVDEKKICRRRCSGDCCTRLATTIQVSSDRHNLTWPRLAVSRRGVCPSVNRMEYTVRTERRTRPCGNKCQVLHAVFNAADGRTDGRTAYSGYIAERRAQRPTGRACIPRVRAINGKREQSGHTATGELTPTSKRRRQTLKASASLYSGLCCEEEQR